MVSSVTSLTRSGMKDWFVQRISAVYMAIYLIFMVGAIALHTVHAELTYLDWMLMFGHIWFKIATMIFLFSLLFHAWIGVWTIFTDYIHCRWVRGILMTLVLISLLVFAVLGLWIIGW